jgi:hypothetical protein
MSLGPCIPDLVNSGKLRPDRAEALQRAYDERLRDYSRDMAPAAAEAAATADALKYLEADTLHRARQKLLQARVQQDWMGDLRAKAGQDGVLPIAAAVNRLARVDKQVDALRGRYFATLDKLLADHRRNVVGVLRNKAELETIGRALFGETVDDVNAREMADSIAQVIELARQRFNQAGGHIGKLEGYGLPQSHDARLVRGATYESWRAHPSIERVKVMDLETGGEATGLRRETLLREIFETIRSEGAAKGTPGQRFAGALANRRADPRVLHFADFDDWMAYQGDFGGGDNIYDILTGHLFSMARDTVLMERLGPNPAATVRWLQDSIGDSVQLRGTQKEVDTINRGKGKLQRLFDELTGESKIPENRRLALVFSFLRSQQVAAKLGSAVLSALPDFATLMRTQKFNGVPAIKAVAQYAKLWNPLDDGDRRLAVRLGLITDDWIGMTSSAHRYLGEELQGEVAKRMADFVIRAQGLSRHTRNGQWATGMNFIATLTHNATHGWANLHPKLREQMRKYGITEADWDAYRTTGPREERGTDWIVPLDMADSRAGERFMEFILTETDHAIVVPDVRTRAAMNSWLKPGTWPGEIARSSVLFKGFPMAIISLHGRRMIEQSSLPGKLGYAVPLGLSMVALGALSAQLKMVAAGKDPQPMIGEGSGKFWSRAVVQSGGLGLFGDLLFNSENSYGGGLTGTLAGPVLGQTLPNVADATAGNALRAAGVGEGDPEFAKDLWNTLEKEVPGRNLWFARQSWERLIADQVDELVDPDVAKARRRMINRARKEGTEYYWKPGELAPDRAPDFENALEGDIPGG